jgi:hypothetical protein
MQESVMRPKLAPAVLSGLFVAAGVLGCAAFPGGGFKSGEQWEPHVKTDEPKWDVVNKEGRGHQPMTDEGDPLNKWLRSEKATEIERSLGYK